MTKQQFGSATIWSASPTPFTKSLDIDTASLKRAVQHHLRIGVQGIFLGGTCGEGPWMPEPVLRKLVTKTCDYAAGIAV